MRLTASAYRPLEVDVRTGLAADFRLTPAPTEKGVIYQQVNISYKAEGERTPTLCLFTEAWVVNPKRKKTPVIDQGGTDAFIVSTRAVQQFGGVVKIVTIAWHEAGALDKTFKKGRGRSLSGTLYGVKGHWRAPPASSARPLKRAVTATVENTWVNRVKMVRFKFENTQTGRRFACDLECNRCTARTNRGARCRRCVCVGTKVCFKHRKRDMGQRVAPSTIPGAGKGLFATHRLPSNTHILTYDGEKLTNAQLNQRYDTDDNGEHAPYGLRVTQPSAQHRGKTVINGLRSRSTSNVRYSNNAPALQQQCARRRQHQGLYA